MGASVDNVNNSHMVPAPAGLPVGTAPLGLVKPDRFDALFNEWRRMPLDDPASAVGGFLQPWVSADMGGTNEFKYKADGGLDYSHCMFLITGTKGNDDLIQLIKDTRVIVEASPLKGKAYVYGDVYTYWGTMIGLNEFLWKILGITVCVMFVSALLLLQSPMSALIVAMMSIMIVLNTYGAMTQLLTFNMFTCAAILASTGLSIEFTAHVTSCFVLTPGTPEKRLATAMRETYPAIFQGSVSTSLSIAPLLFHNIPFVTLYFGVFFLVLTGIGMFHGMVVLPSLLALSARILACFGIVNYKNEENADNSEDADIVSTEGAATLMTSSAKTQETKDTQRI